MSLLSTGKNLKRCNVKKCGSLENRKQRGLTHLPFYFSHSFSTFLFFLPLPSLRTLLLHFLSSLPSAPTSLHSPSSFLRSSPVRPMDGSLPCTTSATPVGPAPTFSVCGHRDRRPPTLTPRDPRSPWSSPTTGGPSLPLSPSRTVVRRRRPSSPTPRAPDVPPSTVPWDLLPEYRESTSARYRRGD